MSTDNIHPASASIHVYMPILLASWPSEGMYVEGMYADPYSWYSARLGLADAIRVIEALKTGHWMPTAPIRLQT